MRRIGGRHLTGLLAAGVIACASAIAQQIEPSSRDRVVVVGTVPIPDVGEGAPIFTSIDVETIEHAARKTATDARRDFQRCRGERDPVLAVCFPNTDSGLRDMLACEFEYATKAANLANIAAEATRAAEDVRSAAAAGKADTSAVEATELVRQDAVNRMRAAQLKLLEQQGVIGDYQKAALSQGRQSSLALAVERKRAGKGVGAGMPDKPAGLSITNVTALIRIDKKGEFVLVQGRIQNSGPNGANVPDLTATLIDERGYPLISTTVSPKPKRSIAATSTQDFAFEVRPAFQATNRAIVTFASKLTPAPRLGVGLFCR